MENCRIAFVTFFAMILYFLGFWVWTEMLTTTFNRGFQPIGWYVFMFIYGYLQVVGGELYLHGAYIMQLDSNLPKLIFDLPKVKFVISGPKVEQRSSNYELWR